MHALDKPPASLYHNRRKQGMDALPQSHLQSEMILKILNEKIWCFEDE